jgi:hypothetical protein
MDHGCTKDSDFTLNVKADKRLEAGRGLGELAYGHARFLSPAKSTVASNPAVGLLCQIFDKAMRKLPIPMMEKASCSERMPD